MKKKFEYKEKETKLVFDPFIARALIRKNHKVVDCKPLKWDRDKTVIVFKNTKEFKNDLNELYIKDCFDVDVETVSVVDPRIARYLLRRNMNLVDYKFPEETGKLKTMFIFEKTPEFDAVLEEITAEVKARDEAKRKPETEIEVDFEIEVEVDDGKLCVDLD